MNEIFVREALLEFGLGAVTLFPACLLLAWLLGRVLSLGWPAALAIAYAVVVATAVYAYGAVLNDGGERLAIAMLRYPGGGLVALCLTLLFISTKRY